MGIVWERASSHVSAMQKAMQGEIAERVERMADNVFKTVQGNRATIANNYLAVKGFAGASKRSIFDYVARGKGRGLSSIGDFLSSVASISSVKTKAAEGIGAGLKKVMPAFSGKLIPVVNDINKVNGLVNEYMSVFTQVRMRWRLGLGKYLLKADDLKNENNLKAQKMKDAATKARLRKTANGLKVAVIKTKAGDAVKLAKDDKRVSSLEKAKISAKASGMMLKSECKDLRAERKQVIL